MLVLVGRRSLRAAVDRHQRDRHVGRVGRRWHRHDEVPRVRRPRKIIRPTRRAAVIEPFGSAERRRERGSCSRRRRAARTRSSRRPATRPERIPRPRRLRSAASRATASANAARYARRACRIADRIRDARSVRRNARKMLGAGIGRDRALRRWHASAASVRRCSPAAGAARIAHDADRDQRDAPQPRAAHRETPALRALGAPLADSSPAWRARSARRSNRRGNVRGATSR